MAISKVQDGMRAVEALDFDGTYKAHHDGFCPVLDLHFDVGTELRSRLGSYRNVPNNTVAILDLARNLALREGSAVEPFDAEKAAAHLAGGGKMYFVDHRSTKTGELQVRIKRASAKQLQNWCRYTPFMVLGS